MNLTAALWDKTHMHTLSELPLYIQLAVAHVFVHDDSGRVVTINMDQTIFGSLTYGDLLPSLREAAEKGVITLDSIDASSVRVTLN